MVFTRVLSHWHWTFYSHGDLRACLSSLIRRSMHSLRSKYSSESPSHPHWAAHSTCAITAYGNLPGAPPLTAGRHQVSTKLPGAGTGGWPPVLPAEALWVSNLLCWPSERADHGRMVMFSALFLRNNPRTPSLASWVQRDKVKSLGLPVQAPAAQGAQGGMAGLKKKSSHSQSCHLQVHTAED